VTGRVLAPFGARGCEVVERRETGGYVVFSALDRVGPDPAPGQFYMLSGAGWGADGGARSCLAPSRSRRRPAPTAV
jgi:hypothetical protein